MDKFCFLLWYFLFPLHCVSDLYFIFCMYVACYEFFFGHLTWASQVAQVVKNPPASAGDAGGTGSIPGSGRSPGEGNGNPLQCSCLENPRDGGAWWAAIYGVAQSRTRLKRLSSSSRSNMFINILSSHMWSLYFLYVSLKLWCMNTYKPLKMMSGRTMCGKVFRVKVRTGL